jgi:hypothetical protein
MTGWLIPGLTALGEKISKLSAKKLGDDVDFMGEDGERGR